MVDISRIMEGATRSWTQTTLQTKAFHDAAMEGDFEGAEAHREVAVASFEGALDAYMEAYQLLAAMRALGREK